jgi:hypothetical protein
MVVQQDVDKVLNDLEAISGKPTATHLRHLCSEVLDSRMLRWVILHEQLDENYIHPTKSVHLLYLEAGVSQVFR